LPSTKWHFGITSSSLSTTHQKSATEREKTYCVVSIIQDIMNTIPMFPTTSANAGCMFFEKEKYAFKISKMQHLVAIASILLIHISIASGFTHHSVTVGFANQASTLFARNNDGDDDDIPSMDWLTDSLSVASGDDKSETTNKYNDESMSDMNSSPFLEEHSIDGDLGDVPIPTTGLSVSDEMEKAQKDRFYTQLVPISGLGKGVEAVRVLSSTTDGAYEAVRYLVRLTRKIDESDSELEETGNNKSDQTKSSIESKDDFVMVDVPPFTEKLAEEMKALMGPNGRLSTILVTSQECIHYDENPGVVSKRNGSIAFSLNNNRDRSKASERIYITDSCIFGYIFLLLGV